MYVDEYVRLIDDFPNVGFSTLPVDCVLIHLLADELFDHIL